MNKRERERLLLLAESQFRGGNPGHARLILEDLVASPQAPPKAHELLGYIHGNAGNLALAHHHLESACRLPGHSAEAAYYLGVSLLKQDQPQAAIGAFTRAIAVGGPFFQALHDLGTAYSRIGDRKSALATYDRALKLDPASFDLLFNIGKVYDELKDFGNALAYYERAARIAPNVADVWAHLGAVLYDTKRYVEAITHWERALALAPETEFLFGFLVHARLRLCDWSRWEADRADILRGIEAERNTCGPFEALAIVDSERIQQKASRRWVAEKFAPASAPGGPRRRAGERIRVGYFSADFARHPVAYLTAELIERHDRDAFEVVGFSLARAPAGDPMRVRLASAFDRFIEVEDHLDGEIVAAARDLGIDIAVDLGGHTRGSRTGVLQRRAAPIQVNFLGYPGTLGAGFVDYMIADATTIPPASREFYDEKIVFLPDCFQPSDTTRVAAPALARSAYGLPEAGFVFCCFNNSYKLNPQVFGSWMRILAAVEGSCLWLLGAGEPIEANLRREARTSGVDPGRLVFGGSVAYADYLGRYRRADLFLDTLPFNAGTTANDALWAGLPVLTKPGASFAGRMAASLLRTLDLPELVAPTQDAYESTAIRLARDAAELGRIKARLERRRRDGPLFDTAGYARHLEAAYCEMVGRAESGLPPDHIEVTRRRPGQR